jgi:hypothetical protein
MKTWIIILIAVIVVGASAYMFYYYNKSNQEQETLASLMNIGSKEYKSGMGSIISGVIGGFLSSKSEVV